MGKTYKAMKQDGDSAIHQKRASHKGHARINRIIGEDTIDPAKVKWLNPLDLLRESDDELDLDHDK